MSKDVPNWKPIADSVEAAVNYAVKCHEKRLEVHMWAAQIERYTALVALAQRKRDEAAAELLNFGDDR